MVEFTSEFVPRAVNSITRVNAVTAVEEKIDFGAFGVLVSSGRDDTVAVKDINEVCKFDVKLLSINANHLEPPCGCVSAAEEA